MSRPRIRNAKHRREYVIMTEDSYFHIRKFYVREGYKSLLLREFVNRFPDLNVSIYVLSSVIISNIE